jgi:hypothetical protein
MWHYVYTPSKTTLKMALCYGSDCDADSPFSPPQSPYSGPLMRSENSAEIAAYHAVQAARDAAHAARTCRRRK